MINAEGSLEKLEKQHFTLREFSFLIVFSTNVNIYIILIIIKDKIKSIPLKIKNKLIFCVFVEIENSNAT